MLKCQVRAFTGVACLPMQDIVSCWWKTGHAKQVVNISYAKQGDESAPSLCLYLPHACHRQTIRLDPIILKHQLCIGTARDVKQQCSGRVHRDKMLLKCSCCSLEDQTATERCITDLSNGKYRTVLEFYSHCLKRQRWKKENKTKQTNKPEKQYGLMTRSYSKNVIGSIYFCVSKRGKVGQSTDKIY